MNIYLNKQLNMLYLCAMTVCGFDFEILSPYVLDKSEECDMYNMLDGCAFE